MTLTNMLCQILSQASRDPRTGGKSSKGGGESLCILQWRPDDTARDVTPRLEAKQKKRRPEVLFRSEDDEGNTATLRAKLGDLF